MRLQCCGKANMAGNECLDCPLKTQVLPPPTNQPAMGWLCPRCNVVNAPSVQKCNCHFGGPTFSGGVTAR